MSSENGAEAMTERELGETQKRAEEAKTRAAQGWDGIVSDGDAPRDRVLDFLEGDVPELAEDLLKATREVRRSHAEAAELRKDIENLRDGFKRANAQESLLWKVKFELDAENAELRERVGSLERILELVSQQAPSRLVSGDNYFYLPQFVVEKVRVALSQTNAQAKLENQEEKAGSGEG